MIHFRQVTKEDIPLMHLWFNEPHVQKFYSLRSWTKSEVLDKLLPTIELNKPLFGFIVLFEGIPIGYLQYCKVKDFPWPEQEFSPKFVENAAGLDFFIGQPEWVGKGWGPKIIERFLDTQIWTNFQYCVVDPDVRNLLSIRMFEKCGFEAHRTIHTKDAMGEPVKLLLMVKSNDESQPICESCQA